MNILLNARKRIDEVNKAKTRLKTVREEHESAYDVEVEKLQDKEVQLLARLNKFEEAYCYCNVDAADDDVIEINAGGRSITARRGTLTQLKGSRMEALFSGRWDKKILRDNNGHVFLDVNSDCFQAIVDKLNVLDASPRDESRLEHPGVYEELEPILQHQLELFGVINQNNSIIPFKDLKTIREWLREDGVGGDLTLLHRSSRDGLSSEAFHQNCDNKGSTLIAIETTEDELVGGFSNTSWQSSGGYTAANKAFLFVLNGFGVTSPIKMKLKDTNVCAIESRDDYGPIFGNGKGSDDMLIKESYVTLRNGNAYEDASLQISGKHDHDIKEMEVFHVTYETAPANKVDQFSKEINEAINEKWESLHALEAEIVFLEESFTDEEHFVASFASGIVSDIIQLNVSGSTMATKRDTLLFSGDSMLAQRFDDTKWTEQGSGPRVRKWSPSDVAKWVKSTEYIPNDTADVFMKNEINGVGLLALDRDGLRDIGVKCDGTIGLLLKEIKQLEKACHDVVTQIEHSPYYFGKILDYLRLKQQHAVNLSSDEPSPPSIRESQKKSFEKVVDYYFPGDSSKFILG